MKIEETSKTSPTIEKDTKAIRPKVKAAGGGTVGVILLTLILKACSVDVEDIDPLILVAVAGAVPTVFAYIKKDGLAGVWTLIKSGQSGMVRINNNKQGE